MAPVALSAFQQCCSAAQPLPNTAFVGLLTVLGAAGCWDVALKVYSIVPVAVSPLPPPLVPSPSAFSTAFYLLLLPTRSYI